nr:RecName: Full=Cathepsin L2 [Fasciola hepatica]
AVPDKIDRRESGYV